jgi:hypothetical protein
MGAKPTKTADQDRADAGAGDPGFKDDDDRRPARCEYDDMKARIDDWDGMRQKARDRHAKPVIVFVGNSGVGKSSTIVNLIPSIDPATRASLNICRGTREGTVRHVRIESDHLVCIDSRGKRHEESVSDYVAHIASEITRSDSIDDVAFIVGILGYDHVRSNDIDALYQSIKAICEIVDRPFIVLQNQRDLFWADGDLLRDRLIKCEDIFPSIERPARAIGASEIGNTSLFRGVFAVAAAPKLRFDTVCPAGPDVNDFDKAAHSVALKCGNRARACRDCRKVVYDAALDADPVDPPLRAGGDKATGKSPETIIKGAIDQWKEYKATLPDDFLFVPVTPSPEGLRMGDPAMEAVFGSLEGEALDAVVKACSSSMADRMQEVRRIIKDHVKNVWTVARASQCDGALCRRLSNYFDLPKTGDYYGQSGTDLWKKPLWTTDMFQAGVRVIFDMRKLQNYTASWGIFHALKFRDMHAELLASYARGRSPDECIRSATEVAKRYTPDLAKEIWKHAKRNGIERAYDTYLVASGDPRDLSGALSCPATSATSP